MNVVHMYMFCVSQELTGTYSSHNKWQVSVWFESMAINRLKSMYTAADLTSTVEDNYGVGDFSTLTLCPV